MPPLRTVRAAGVDGQVGHLQRRPLRGRTRPVAQKAAQSGQQFPDAKGLGHVVLRAGIQQGDLVGLGRADRQDQDRDLAPFAQSGKDRAPVHVGQAQVQDHRLGGGQGAGLDAVAAGGGLGHVMALRLQRDPQETADRGLVVDDQDAGGQGHAGVSSGRVRVIRVPRPSARAGWAAMVPPWASTMPRAMARPRPVPAR